MVTNCLYVHQQQNKRYPPQMFLLVHFKATLYYSLANLLAHNNKTMHKLLCASKFDTAKIECRLICKSKNILGCHL